MRVNAFQRLLTAVEDRKQANRDMVRACQDLASRIAKLGRVHDSIKRHGQHYVILNAVQDLVDEQGRERESKPIKVLGTRNGDLDWDATHTSFVQDTRRLVSLSPLVFDYEGLIPKGEPHDATAKESYAAIMDGYLEPEDIGAMIFSKTTEYDYSEFAENAAAIVQDFTELYEEQIRNKQAKVEKLVNIAKQLDGLAP